MKESKKLYSQTEIANILGISEATVSRMIKKGSFSAKRKNSQKLFDESVLKELRKQRKPNNSNTSTRLSTIELLQEQIAQLKNENATLKDQLKIKDSQIETANKLADQAQHLHLSEQKHIDNSIAQIALTMQDDESKEHKETIDADLQAKNEELQNQLDSIENASFIDRIFKRWDKNK